LRRVKTIKLERQEKRENGLIKIDRIKVFDRQGYFHCWMNLGPENDIVAVVEFEDGTIGEIASDMVQFINPASDD
jgi:hypothetical protein